MTDWERAIQRTVENVLRQQYSRSPTSSRTSHHPKSPKRHRTCSRTPPTYLRSSHHSKPRSPDRNRSITPTYSRSYRRSRSRTPTQDYGPPRKSRRQSRSPPRSHQSRPQDPPESQSWYGFSNGNSNPARLAGSTGVNLVPVGENQGLTRFYLPFKKRPNKSKSKPIPPVVDLEPQPSVVRKVSKKSKTMLKQPSAEVRKEFVYTSPEQPNFIPEIKSPKALPVRVNDPESLETDLPYS